LHDMAIVFRGLLTANTRYSKESPETYGTNWFFQVIPPPKKNNPQIQTSLMQLNRQDEN
jgi:hypothetical protein